MNWKNSDKLSHLIELFQKYYILCGKIFEIVKLWLRIMCGLVSSLKHFFTFLLHKYKHFFFFFCYFFSPRVIIKMFFLLYDEFSFKTLWTHFYALFMLSYVFLFGCVLQLNWIIVVELSFLNSLVLMRCLGNVKLWLMGLQNVSEKGLICSNCVIKTFSIFNPDFRVVLCKYCKRNSSWISFNFFLFPSLNFLILLILSQSPSASIHNHTLSSLAWSAV